MICLCLSTPNSAGFLAVFLASLAMMVTIFLGWIIFGYYHDNDPVLLKRILKGDQVKGMEPGRGTFGWNFHHGLLLSLGQLSCMYSWTSVIGHPYSHIRKHSFKGALSGMIVSLVLSLWLGIGGIIYKIQPPTLSLTIGNFSFIPPTLAPEGLVLDKGRRK